MENDDILEEINLDSSSYEKGNYNSLLSLISLYEKNYNFKAIVDIIDENLAIFSDFDKKLTLLNKKIQALLRLEDFNEALKTLIIKSAIPNLDNKEKANILFYEAISYEGLGENYKAICSLLKIEDNLPRLALVNKYLKLSLLYIKDLKFSEAKEAYEYAYRLDINHKNDMFLLVESDLYYASGKYNEALDSFQSFYLKSSQKYKYLDRYIYILIKLNRFDDAYNFFNEYKDKASVRLSKTVKYNFYKAASILLKRLEKYDELILVNSYLESEKPTYFKSKEQYQDGLIKSIVSSLSLPLTIYDKYKNIANKFFKLVNLIPKDELIFIERTKEAFIYSKFNNTELKPTILNNELLKNNNLYDEFNILDDIELDHFYNQKLARIDSPIKAYVIKDSYHFYGYFLVSYNNEYDLVYDTLRNALLFEFIRLDELTKGNNNTLSILKTLENNNFGYIRIKENYVELFDNYSKRLFDSKMTIIPFDNFKELFTEELFVDSFLGDDNIFNKEMKNGKVVEFSVSVIDNTINALVKDITSSKAINDERMDYFYFGSIDFKTINSLKEEVNLMNESYSLIGLYIPFIEEDDLINERDHKLKLIYNFLDRFNKQSSLYYLGENHYMYRLNTVDKRVIESIFNNIKKNIKNLYRYSRKLREEKIFGFASKNLKNKSFDEVKDLIEYGYISSSLKEDFIILDNDEKRNYQLFKMYENETRRFIERKELEEIYYPIVNVETKQIHYFMQDFLYPYELKHETLEKIFRSNELLVSRDIYSFNIAIYNLTKYNNKIRYVIRIHKESLLSPSFTDLLLNEKSEYINKIYLYIDAKDLTLYLDILNKLKNKGYNLSINIDNLIIKDDYSMFKLVFSSLNIDNKFNLNFINNLISNDIDVCMTNKVYLSNALNLDNTIKPYSKDELNKL